jgi:beta-glucosidase
VALEPGESRELEFTLGFEALSFFDARARRVMEPGTRYTLWVGDSSEATPSATFSVT